jgi:hypothetical protein
MQSALDLALEYTHTREQFGKKIATFQLMQGKLAGECEWGDETGICSAQVRFHTGATRRHAACHR